MQFACYDSGMAKPLQIRNVPEPVLESLRERAHEVHMSLSAYALEVLTQHVATKSIGQGQFVIGSSKVRPRIDDVFKREEKMGIYLKIYNFGTEGEDRNPSGQVEYEVTKNGTNEKIFEATEQVSQIPGASARQVTIEKLLPLRDLAPGQYTLRVKITDKNRNQVLTPSAQFTVT